MSTLRGYPEEELHLVITWLEHAKTEAEYWLSPYLQYVTTVPSEFPEQMTIEGEEEETFDFAFVDADKENYLKYHELLVKLVKVGGVIAYDNTLWFGMVAGSDDDEAVPEGPMREPRDALRKLNSFLPTDPRIEVALVSVGDGLTLCRRVS